MENLYCFDKSDKENFSLIEIYPRLNYYTESREEAQRIFETSLNINKCIIHINVRSEEAQQEVSSFLVGMGFDDVESVEGNYVESFENRLIRENGEEFNPIIRQFYEVEKDIDKLYISPSKLGIRVSLNMSELINFKNAIKLLRKNLGYRNKWYTKDENSIIIK